MGRAETGCLRVAQIMRPAAGGMRKHLSLLLGNLPRQRFSPTLFAPADFRLESDVPRREVEIGAKTDPIRDARSILRLSKNLRSNFDVVHAHGLRGALIGVLAAHRAGIPSLFTAHNLVPSMGFLPRLLLRHVGGNAGRIIAVSESVSRSLQAAGLPPHNIVVVPNGIELAPFDSTADPIDIRAAFGIPAGAPLIVGVGRLSREKGFDVLIRAFADVLNRFPEARLVLVGEGPEEENLRSMLPGTALPEPERRTSVLFVGYHENAVPFFHAADVVAIPSREEGQGIVALEAMAARKPVVATNVGGLAETVVHGQTGLLTAPENPAALAEATLLLLNDAKKRADFGNEGRIRVEAFYTSTRMVDRIEQVYLELAGAPKGS